MSLVIKIASMMMWKIILGILLDFVHYTYLNISEKNNTDKHF